MFSITNQDYSKNVRYQIKEKCVKYQEDLSFQWDEVKNAEISGKDFKISNRNLEKGILPIGVMIKYNDVGIKKILGESMLISYKVN